MSIIDEIRSSGGEEEFRTAVQTVVNAEQEGMEWTSSGAGKNTHFELRFGEGTDEVYVYVERLEHDSGLEVMVWVDESYFEGVDADRPEVSDGGSEIEEFVDVLEEYACSAVPGDRHSNMSYHTTAPPSIVFADQFYL